MKLARPQLWALPALLIAVVLSFVFNHKNALGVESLATKIGREGNNGTLILGLSTLLFLAWRAKDGRAALRVVVVMLTETALYGLLKAISWHGFHLLARPSGGDGGFPSGHTAAHVCLAYLLTERFPKLAPLWWAWAGVMGWSRVEAGAHWAYQITAGALLGLAVAATLGERLKAKTEPPPARRGES